MVWCVSVTRDGRHFRTLPPRLWLHQDTGEGFCPHPLISTSFSKHPKRNDKELLQDGKCRKRG